MGSSEKVKEFFGMLVCHSVDAVFSRLDFLFDFVLKFYRALTIRLATFCYMGIFPN